MKNIYTFKIRLRSCAVSNLKLLHSSDNKNINEMSNTAVSAAGIAVTMASPASPAAAMASLNNGSHNRHRNSDIECDIDTSGSDSNSDYGYPDTQPRSLAALAERDRQREQAHKQQLLKQNQQQQQQQQNCVNNNNKTNRTGPQENSNNGNTDGDPERQHRNESGRKPNEISSVMIVEESVSQSVQQRQPFKNINRNTFDVVDSVNVNGCQIIALNPSNNNKTGCAVTINDCGVEQNEFTHIMSKNKGGVAPKEYVLTPMNDKKHRSGGFLSRFAGFRFSLRGNKKKQKIVENHNDPPVNDSVVLVTKGIPTAVSPPVRPLPSKVRGNESATGGYQRNSMRSNDFVYIPLKDPITPGRSIGINDNNNIVEASGPNAVRNIGPSISPNVNATTTTSTTSSSVITASSIAGNHGRPDAFVNNVERKHVVTAKPPLPRLPPRVVGVCAKQPATNSPSSPAAISLLNGRGAAAQRPAQRANSAPREINAHDMRHYRLATADDDDVDFYQQYRLDARMKQSGVGSGIYPGYAGGPNDGTLLHPNINDTSFTDNEGNLTIGADGDYKIGLIETNLDTHETVISGKTRSLMELGPLPGCQGRGQQNVVGARITVGGAPSKTGSIVEPRRPHKSMEFLLDKENQKLVLVSAFTHISNIQ